LVQQRIPREVVSEATAMSGRHQEDWERLVDEWRRRTEKAEADLATARVEIERQRSALLEQGNQVAAALMQELATARAEIERLRHALTDVDKAEVGMRALLRQELAALRAQAAAATRLVRDLRTNCLATYLGGYSSPEQIAIFQHGMETVCNVVEPAARTGAPDPGAERKEDE
jgi:predicted  nucleic acid-binding Zn-ribbon protein